LPNGKYIPGTDFNTIYQLYEFDRKLSQILLSVLVELEIYLRAQLSYHHAHKYGSDGYMLATNFSSRHDHSNFITRLNDLVKSNDKQLLVKHHFANYQGQFPLWVIMELFSFGMLSYFFSDMHAADQKQLAHHSFHTSVANASSWLFCCTILRNFCAHSRRLYNNVFSVIPTNLPQVPPSARRRLFASVMALQRLYPDKDKWNGEFLGAMGALFEEYDEVIQLRFIGFPEDWREVLEK
jgi:abortive infection bacteriophage resistance protein